MVEHKNDLSKYKAYNARYKLYDPTALHLERKALQQPQQQLQKQQKTSITATASRIIFTTVASTTTITVIYELQKICSTTVLIKSNINRKSNFVTIPTIKIAQ